MTVFVILLLRTSNKERVYCKNGLRVPLKRGQCFCGRFKLSDYFGLKESQSGKIYRALNKLEKIDNLIKKQKWKDGTIITILNFDELTSFKKTNEKPIKKQRKSNRQSIDTNKNVKNVKSEKNVNIIADKSAGHEDIVKVFDEFIPINPVITYENKTQRSAAAELIKRFGLEKTINTAKAAVQCQGRKFAPVITNPYQLKIKLPELLAFYKRGTATKVIDLDNL